MHPRRHLKKLIESFKGHFCGQMKMMSNWFGKPKIGFSIDTWFSLCIFFCQMLGILDDISKWSSRLHRYTLCGRMEMWNIGGKSLNDAKKKLTKKWTELQFSSTYLALLFRWNLHCRLQISTSFLHQMGTTFLCNFTKTSRNNAQCAKNQKKNSLA